MPNSTFAELPSKQKKKIFKICVQLLAANGYCHTTIKMITRRLKVADGYLHYYFSGKADLVEWLIDAGMEQWTAHFRKNVDPAGASDVFELVKLIILQQIRFTRDHRQVFAAYHTVMNEPNFPLIAYLVEKLSTIDRFVGDSIAHAVRTGAVRPGTSPELVAMFMDLIITRMQEFAYDGVYDPLGVSRMNEAQVGALIDRIMAMLRDGIAAPPQAAPSGADAAAEAADSPGAEST
jgi:AcrR family transcriptional regulator